MTWHLKWFQTLFSLIQTFLQLMKINNKETNQIKNLIGKGNWFGDIYDRFLFSGFPHAPSMASKYLMLNRLISRSLHSQNIYKPWLASPHSDTYIGCIFFLRKCLYHHSSSLFLEDPLLRRQARDSPSALISSANRK